MRAVIVIRNTERQKAVRELRLQGLCGSEIADRLGIPTESVAAIAKRVGLPFSDEERKRSQELGHKKKCHTDESLRRLVLRYEPTFEYVGGYTGSEGSLRIRCKECGSETTRSIVSIRHKNVRCRECERIERERRKQETRRLCEAKADEETRRREAEFWSRPAKQETFKVCVICGGLFMEKNKTQITCGGECTKKLANRKDRRSRYKGRMVDRDITLEELYRRDKGVCHLCGELCDWNDIRYNADGVKITGDQYPSVDHVIPVSKGGLHAWSNVRLAHRHCNTIKGATV